MNKNGELHGEQKDGCDTKYCKGKMCISKKSQKAREKNSAFLGTINIDQKIENLSNKVVAYNENTFDIKKLENDNNIHSVFWAENEDNINWVQEEIVLDFGDKEIKTIQDVCYINNKKIAIRYNSDDLDDQDSYDRVIFTDDIKKITEKELEDLKAKKDHEMVYKHLNNYHSEDADEKFYDYVGSLNDDEIEEILDEDFSTGLREEYDKISEKLEDKIKNYIEKTLENVNDGVIDRNDVCTKEIYDKAVKNGTELELAKDFFYKKDSLYINTVDSDFEEDSSFKQALARVAYKKIGSKQSHLLEEYIDMLNTIYEN